MHDTGTERSKTGLGQEARGGGGGGGGGRGIMLLMMMMIDTGLPGQEACLILKMAVVCIFSLGRTDLKILFEQGGGGGREGFLNKVIFHSSPLLASFYLLGQDWRLHYRSIYTQACIVLYIQYIHIVQMGI